MKKVLLTMLVLVLGLVFIVSAAAPVAASTQGLTPGFWKNHQSLWVGFSPDDIYFDVFEVGPDDITLLQALRRGGGGEKAFGRHSVAALLNSTYLTSTFTTTFWVISDVQLFYGTGEFEDGKNFFEGMNELGVPDD